MKKKLTLIFALLLAASALNAQMPRMETVGGKKRLAVDGKPFIMLAGELHNSTTGSVQNMTSVWKRLSQKNLNTVFAVVSWELFEPQEGKYDYSILDHIVSGASQAGLKVGILWFGSWKNGESTYAPAWVKKDGKRFPRACFKGGEKMNVLSTLGTATRDADAKAFAAMMARLKAIDPDHTVVIVQVENEMGTVDFPAVFSGGENRCQRDYSPAADKAFKGAVPQELTAYLSANFDKLHPALAHSWASNGKKMKGSWEEVFGKGQPRSGDGQWLDEYPYFTEEIFMAWNYASYVEKVASAGKAEYALPMYVNAWLKQSSGKEPGMYPCGAALPHVFDIWKAAAPSIDFYAPDIYALEVYDETCTRFSTGENPLFIPETTSDAAGAARLFYTIGKWGATCYSPFGIDGYTDKSYDSAYGLLKKLLPLVQEHIGSADMAGLLTNSERTEDSAEFGDYKITVTSNSSTLKFMGDHAEMTAGGNAAVSGLMVIRTAPDEFLLAGFGEMKIDLGKSSSCKGDHAYPLSVDELIPDMNGELVPHRLNGDEIFSAAAMIGGGQAKAFKIKMYQY